MEVGDITTNVIVTAAAAGAVSTLVVVVVVVAAASSNFIVNETAVIQQRSRFNTINAENYPSRLYTSPSTASAAVSRSLN